MKKLASLVLAGAMAFSLAACGNNSTPAGGSSANAGTSTPAASTPASGGIEPIELTIYSPGNENSVPTKTIIEYARLVNEASDGAITLDVHHSNELGSDAESIESTRMGTIDLIFAGTSGFTSFYEKAKVLDLPFRDDVAKPNRDNAIDVYIGDTPEDVIGDDVWAETFTRQPEPLTAEEKKEYLSHVTGVCLGSDAFFPFGDNIERARRSGVTAIVQPGGSIRDQQVIDTCNKYGIAMAFCGIRLFHH